MNTFLTILLVVTGTYLLITILVGRYLLFQDIFPRKVPDGAVELNGYDFEDIEFKGFDNITLRGWFIKSHNNPLNKTIFLLHGWTRVRSRYISQIKFFVDSGFHVLTYDQRSHGASDTGQTTFGPDEAKDLLKAVEFAEKYDFFDKERIAAVGFSLGASAIVYAAIHQIFKAIVVEGIFPNSYDVGEETLRRSVGKIGAQLIGKGIFTVGSLIWTLGKFRHGSPVEYVGQVSPTPIMVIRGEDDERVPSASVKQFLEEVKEPKEIWIHDSYHTKSFIHYPDEYRKRVLGFLDKYLEY